MPPADSPGEWSGSARAAADPAAEAELDRLARSEAIGGAFDRLREDERILLAMHYVDERPVAEIARTLGIPVGTVKWRLHAARAALERALEAER